MIEGLVSTIVPVFNRARLLQDAVESVLAQTYRPIEIILVDDGSSDDTPAVITGLCTSHPDCIRSVRIGNSGPGIARETGRQLAQGEYIQYLDSDDLLFDEKLENQVEGLKSHPDCRVSYGMTRFRHTDGKLEPQPWKRSGERIETMFPSFLQSRWWSTGNPLYRRAICDMVGPWSGLRTEEDWEYDCRIASMGVKLHYVPEYVCEIRDHTGHRLSKDRSEISEHFGDRLDAHEQIFGHACRAGIQERVPEMRHFARECFLLARQCGAAGLPSESYAFFKLARKASEAGRRNSLEFLAYRASAAILGWKLVGALSCQMDKLRR